MIVKCFSCLKEISIDFLPPESLGLNRVYICQECSTRPITHPTSKMTNPFLPDKPGKTKKLHLAKGRTAEEGITHSRTILNSEPDTSRIEFRSGDFYYVVAKLRKEKE